MSPPRLERSDERSWALAGELTAATIPALLADLPAAGLGGDAELSLAGVERIDSASIALLLLLARRARGAGGKLRFTDVPDGMLAIARLCGVEDLLAAR